ncbi:tRNA (adenosine(37)-N6)-threonylcarbamoyltransferase complex ATPase subunit type 1 TsaE [Candidatus Uhrbacteria bacterium]|nr:tRNA (adenosine(37)-N6)-threonylcarbamoyltransferase complex ATPase subunit type 1 TsaE [Candidatus Uhrbacteria bacterium]
MRRSGKRQAENDKRKTWASRSEQETARIAMRMARTLRGGEVILLDGELGAGKSVFVRGLARGLGIRARVTSPTFVLMRIYETTRAGPRFLVHVDAYRVRNAAELEGIGLSEWIARPDAVVAIEWGARVSELVEKCPRYLVRLAASDQGDDARQITVEYMSE